MSPTIGLWGASGRVGGLLRAEWGDAVHYYSRSAAPGVEPMALGDVPASARRLDALIVAVGPTSGDEMAVHADLARFALELPVERIILFSSAAVYGRMPGPLDERSPGAPASPYGQAKCDMEQAVEGSRALVLRVGNIAGADALLGQLAPTPPRLHLFPDGQSPRRSYIGPRTLAACLLALAKGDARGVLNLAQPPAVSMADLLTAAGRSWEAVPAPAEAIAEVQLETGRAEALLGRLLPPAQASEIVDEWQTLTARL